MEKACWRSCHTAKDHDHKKIKRSIAYLVTTKNIKEINMTAIKLNQEAREFLDNEFSTPCSWAEFGGNAEDFILIDASNEMWVTTASEINEYVKLGSDYDYSLFCSACLCEIGTHKDHGENLAEIEALDAPEHEREAIRDSFRLS